MTSEWGDAVSASVLANGIHYGVPSSVYHARELGVVSKSALDIVDRSPAHYKAWVDGVMPDEDTPALRFGAAFHAYLLEPETWTKYYAIRPDFGDCRTKAGKEARDDWARGNAGKRPVTEDDADRIVAMAKAIRSHALGGRMIRDGHAEVTVRWTDEATGLKCKARADYWVRRLGMVVDVKTVTDGSREAFRKSVASYRYHVQDALYRDAFRAVGERVEHFVFLAVEKDPPHAVSVYTLDADGVSRGHFAARKDIDTLAACLASGTWPGYAESIQTIDLPPWAA